MSTLLTVREAASRLNISEGFLNRLRSTGGDGPAFHRIGRAIRYRVEDLDDWTSRHAVRPDAEHETA